MREIAKFPLRVPADRALAVLKALSNESRIRIMRLLAEEPRGVTEIARLIGVSQPTATVYIQQLEEAGLISNRLVKTPQGVQKISYTLYDSVQIDWTSSGVGPDAEEYTVDVPVGHYTMIQCNGRSLMASKSRIIASKEDVSRFFNPVRMEAELLVLEEGSVRYLFPYNIPPSRIVRSLTLGMEVSVAYPAPGHATRLTLHVNGNAIGPVSLESPDPTPNTAPMPSWLPADFHAVGRLLQVEIGLTETKLNSKVVSPLTLGQLGLNSMKPVEVSITVEGDGTGPAGLILYGKSFGIRRHDLRATISHAADERAASDTEGTA